MQATSSVLILVSRRKKKEKEKEKTSPTRTSSTRTNSSRVAIEKYLATHDQVIALFSEDFVARVECYTLFK